MAYYLLPLLLYCLIIVGSLSYKVLLNQYLKYIQIFRISKFKLPPFVRRYIRIDESFTDAETILIIEALQEWERKTSGLVAFSIVSLMATEIFDEKNNCLPAEVSDKEPYEVFTFIRAASTDRIVKKIENMTKTNACGFAHHHNFAYIALVVDRLYTDNLFKSTVMHEIGHLFGMEHLGKKTLMYKQNNRAIRTLTVQDLNHFLKCYNWYELPNRPEEILEKFKAL